MIYSGNLSMLGVEWQTAGGEQSKSERTGKTPSRSIGK
jgi:hypothetical protein